MSWLMYKGFCFVQAKKHLDAYRNGELIANVRISEAMTLEDVVEVINEFLEM